MRVSFDTLARSLVEQRRRYPFPDPDAGTVVVVPSLSFPSAELRKIVGIQHYEERLLFALLLLKRPGLQLAYVTSAPIEPAVIDYYLGFLPDPEDARKRLHLIDLGDPSPTSLSAKLLADHAALERLGRAVGDRDDAYLVTFNGSEHERLLAERLGIPLFGPDPELSQLGSKTGSRRIARAANVPVLPGDEDLWSIGEVEAAIGRLHSQAVSTVVVKLNNGFSGKGNAIVELKGLEAGTIASTNGRAGDLLAAASTNFCAVEESWESFAGKIADEGAIVEELLRAQPLHSPSVQMCIAPGGGWRVISTHDQILGGPGGQVYLGCRFPAQTAYRLPIQHAAERVTQILAAEGVVGGFGIDFFVVPGADPGIWLCEINLRLGGTTHPFWMARLVTDGWYDTSTGQLVAGGRAKYYTASDNVESPKLVGLEPVEVIRRLTASGLAYDHSTRTGTTLHLLGALREHGKMGVVCIADSTDEADALYEEVLATFG
jgi:PGM1 C-terminal domain/ATP-grasp domain